MSKYDREDFDDRKEFDDVNADMVELDIGKVTTGRALIELYKELSETDIQLQAAITSVRNDRGFDIKAVEKDERVAVKLLLHAYKHNKVKIQELESLSLQIIAF